MTFRMPNFNTVGRMARRVKGKLRLPEGMRARSLTGALGYHFPLVVMPDEYQFVVLIGCVSAKEYGLVGRRLVVFRRKNGWLPEQDQVLFESKPYTGVGWPERMGQDATRLVNRYKKEEDKQMAEEAEANKASGEKGKLHALTVNVNAAGEDFERMILVHFREALEEGAKDKEFGQVVQQLREMGLVLHLAPQTGDSVPLQSLGNFAQAFGVSVQVSVRPDPLPQLRSVGS